MLSVDELLGIVWTEAIGQNYDFDEPPPYSSDVRGAQDNLPPIRFHLQLLENPETGELYWVE